MIKPNLIVYKILKADRFCLYERLLQYERLSAEQQQQEQRKSLKAILDLAYSSSPYYREKYRDFGGCIDAVDIKALPILSKQEVKAHAEDMVVEGIEKDQVYKGHTGGSTGTPVGFYYGMDALEKMEAACYRFYRWAGWRPGDKILHLWGAAQDISATAGLKKRLVEWVLAEKTIGVYEFSEETLGAWCKEIIEYKPVLLQGYASILAGVANYILDQRIAIPGSIKGVFSTAEVLYPNQRETIERAFGCKVFNQYGSREIPGIACECSEGNMHIFTDMAYVETENESTGESRLIITSLSNTVMPFIRYDIGDLGALKSGVCQCGSNFPMMEMGLCRSNDIIKTRSGKNMYPSYFIHLLDPVEGVEQYRFHQSSLEKITLFIKNSPALNKAKLETLQDKVRQEVDNSMELSIEYVDRLERTQSGKYRFVTTDIK